eukprot:CAMPEP_0197623692 /NCGR_PEP_ID=MMETSP1338-20131121/3653_1 /TAXON_ID=43686 ORGANISM="Pelagodinium beii, Strain RCC1491" /NCGR_SAMPLE_ID=MMETSP1338 /ASSEMBLY_ACC=CAM_ASM_000754 /LENGTH=416 /DNA_ID=CAMNT_0043193749 /DNA_START=64 /DNA_END=1310 /DNA_ORIENTATION=-
MLTLAIAVVLLQSSQGDDKCSIAQSQGTTLLQKSSSEKTTRGSNYGLKNCPCVGLDHVEGHLAVTYNGKIASYPADLGSHCKEWDDGHTELQCGTDQTPGAGNGYCKERWCYVDACNCNITVQPKLSTYFPDATWRGKPLHYSYGTCGSQDTWTQDEKASAEDTHPNEGGGIEEANANKTGWWSWLWNSSQQEANEEDLECGHRAWDSSLGKSDCRCIGIDGQTGVVDFTIDDAQYQYPAGTGAKCMAWDLQNHPKCKGHDVPSWCWDQWCYVDPCACGIHVPPKKSWYIREATVGLRPVYYSYSTCGHHDDYSMTNEDACVNQLDEAECLAIRHPGQPDNKVCSWGGPEMKCLGKELLEVCELTVRQIEDWSFWGFTGAVHENVILWKIGTWGLGGVFAILAVLCICMTARLDQL